MQKASASSAQPANSSSNPRPPPHRRAAEISAAPSLPSYPQASGMSMGPHASTQPEPAQIPARTQPTASLNPPGPSILARRLEGVGQ
ncbi:uncharacterized protein L203_104614 [Cryptococcus depauperatus CBS 7841]|uniref:Uncharacterized protein n=1 Tax=Cryptococcus depauperatus CBS 7841 TaxID=1295531 RepID=A0AAJ8JVS5_9TREE